MIFTAITASDQDRDKVLYEALGSAPRIFARWPEPQTVDAGHDWGDGGASGTDWGTGTGTGTGATATDWGPGNDATRWHAESPDVPPTDGGPSGKRRWRGRARGPQDPTQGQPPSDTGSGDPDWGENGWNSSGGQPPNW